MDLPLILHCIIGLSSVPLGGTEITLKYKEWVQPEYLNAPFYSVCFKYIDLCNYGDGTRNTGTTDRTLSNEKDHHDVAVLKSYLGGAFAESAGSDIGLLVGSYSHA